MGVLVRRERILQKENGATALRSCLPSRLIGSRARLNYLGYLKAVVASLLSLPTGCCQHSGCSGLLRRKSAELSTSLRGVRVCKGCIKGVQISLRCSGFVLQERTNSAVQTAGPSEFEGTFYSAQRQTDSHGQNGANLALSAELTLPLHIQPRRHVGYCSP